MATIAPNMQQPGAQPGGAATPADNKPLDPVQLKYFNLIVSQCMRFVTAKENAYQIVRKAKAMDPVKAVAEAVGPLIESIYHVGSAGVKKVGQPDIGIVTLLSAGIAVTAKVAEMLSKAGVIQESQIPQVAADAAKIMVTEHNAKVSAGGKPQPAGMAGMPMAPAPQTVQ